MITYMILCFLFLATAAVVFNTWRNAQATRNMSHVIHATEIARQDK